MIQNVAPSHWWDLANISMVIGIIAAVIASVGVVVRLRRKKK